MRHGSFHGSHCYLKATLDERKTQFAERKKNKKNVHESDTPKSRPNIPATHPFVHRNSQTSLPGDNDFEEAINQSIAATSRGNEEEDAMIEKAIRASVKELQSASQEGDDRDAIQRAIQASVAEAAKARGGKGPADGLDGASDHNRELEAALHRSITEHHAPTSENNLANADFDDSGVDTDDDENVKAAIERSKSAETDEHLPAYAEDEGLEKVIELSRKAHEEHEQGLAKSKTEEEIVLEYIKRQSFAEEEHKKSVASQ